MAIHKYSKSLNLYWSDETSSLQALHTNTSSVRSCLLQRLFIDCLVTFLYDWVGIADTQNGTRRMSQPVDSRTFKENVFPFSFLNAGTFSCLLLHSMRATFTHYPGSQSQLWAFFDPKKRWERGMRKKKKKKNKNKKGKLSKSKKREAKLSSQGHHLKKQNKK